MTHDYLDHLRREEVTVGRARPEPITFTPPSEEVREDDNLFD